MERDAEHLGGRRRHRRPVTHGCHAVEFQPAQRIERPHHAMVELHGQGAIAPRIAHAIAVIGRQCEFKAQAMRCIRELADLVASGGGEKEKAFAHCFHCAAGGSKFETEWWR
jgi:hypothetical protein